MDKIYLHALPILCCMIFTLSCILLWTTPDRLIGASFCHQIPSRSPEFNFPYCYRCSGLFSGILAGETAFFLCRQQRKDLLSRSKLIFVVIGIFFFLIDILNSSKFSDISFYPESVNIRFLSAFPLGYFLAQIVFQLLNYWIDLPVFRFSDGIAVNMLMMIAGIAAAYISILCHIPILLTAARFLLPAGSLLFLSALYTLFVICYLLLKNEPFSQKNVILSGVAFALVHIVILGGLHVKFLNFERYFS